MLEPPRTNPSCSAGQLPPKMNQTTQGLAQPHLESFNYFLEQGLATAVADLEPVEIQAEKGGPTLRFWLEQPEVGKPAHTDDSVESRKFPSECRERGIHYNAPMHAYICSQIVGSGDDVTRHQKKFGMLPIMIGSKACNLHGLTPKQMVAHHEEATEMGGYFICNGNEKVVRLLQMPRRNHAMAVQRGAFAKRGPGYSDRAVSMKCCRPDQSAVTVTLHYLLDGGASLRFSAKKQEFFIPVVVVLRALLPISDKEIFDRTLAGDYSNTFLRSRLEALLVTTQENHSGLFLTEPCRAYIGAHFRALLEKPDGWTDAEVGVDLLKRYVLVNQTDNGDKADVLISMLRKLYLFAAGEVCEDHPDALCNQELLLPGHFYTFFVKEKLQELMWGVRASIKKDARMAQMGRRDAVNLRSATYLRKQFDRQMDIGMAVNSLLATGNLVSTSGLDLMQVRKNSTVHRTVQCAVQCSAQCRLPAATPVHARARPCTP
jgi:DNA-directed RNA polymerase I subunit RPA2